jgi:hypothetical protein
MSLWDGGLDWADQHHDVVVHDEAGRRVGSRRVTQNKEGVDDLKPFVVGLPLMSRRWCVVETGHGLLITCLLETGIPVFPNTVHRRKKGGKKDTKAVVMADEGHHDRTQRKPPHVCHQTPGRRRTHGLPADRSCCAARSDPCGGHGRPAGDLPDVGNTRTDTERDDGPESIPATSACRSRREHRGRDLLEERLRRRAGPQSTTETPGACWGGMRVMAWDGTVESVPDTASRRETCRSSADDPDSPHPAGGSAAHRMCDVERRSCRQGEATSAALLRERREGTDPVVLWESGFHSRRAMGALRTHGGEMLGRVIRSAFTDPRIPGTGAQVSRLVTTLLDPFRFPAKELAVLSCERWHTAVAMGETRIAMRVSSSRRFPPCCSLIPCCARCCCVPPMMLTWHLVTSA